MYFWERIHNNEIETLIENKNTFQVYYSSDNQRATEIVVSIMHQFSL